MSIATEIERIQNAKASIKASIENKGVVVGDGTLDTYASKINEITGGGSGSDIVITNCSYLFYDDARLDYLDEILKLCNNVTSTNNMFYMCGEIENIDLSNITFNLTNCASMFTYCRKLKKLTFGNNINTSMATSLNGMFNACSLLVDLDLSKFDFTKILNTYNLFNGCSALTNLNFGVNLGKNYTNNLSNYTSYQLNLSSCTSLTHDSLMSIINNLYDLNLSYDVANGGTLYTQQLILGATNIAKLTSDELSIVTNKGWVVS